jgi:intergrase/recombinase
MATRSEVYAKIKCLNLQEEVKNQCGRNFTQVSTADLEGIIEAYSRQAMDALAKVCAPTQAKNEAYTDVQYEQGSDVDIDVFEISPNETLVQVTAPEHKNCEDAIISLVTVLAQKRIISKKEADVILSNL